MVLAMREADRVKRNAEKEKQRTEYENMQVIEELNPTRTGHAHMI